MAGNTIAGDPGSEGAGLQSSSFPHPSPASAASGTAPASASFSGAPKSPPPPPPRRPGAMSTLSTSKAPPLSVPPSSSSSSSPASVAYFEKETVDEYVTEYKIHAGTTTSATVPLFTLIKALIPGTPLSRKINANQLLMALGKLRSVQLTLADYNASLAIDDDEDGMKRYARFHAIELFSVLGFQAPNATTAVAVPGLDELVASVEEHLAEGIKSQRAAIAAGSVEFEGLGELYLPGSMVAGITSLGGSGAVKAGYRVRSSWFEEKRTLFRHEKCFRVRLECLVAFGRYFALIGFEEVYSGWTGAQVKSLDELGIVVPVVAEGPGSDISDFFARRGEKCVSMVGTGDECRFVEYRAGSFFIHHQQRRSYLVPSVASGRIVIDCERGLMLGHLPSQGSDEVTLAMMNAVARYKRLLGDTSAGVGSASASAGQHKGAPSVETMLLFSASGLPATLRPFIWPALVGFSFAVKAWGHVLVDTLGEITFNDRAFDQLVLAPERKKLIRALVRFGGKATQAKFDDIVSGKSGGSVFLLHGPPGVGKTLTAEAIAELLHKPLYYVTMGELGTNPEEMEKRLGSVLELCSGWDALTIIDEADVFLEKRGSGGGSDVLRNAMVCVMLRLLEYHQGILFLTTNRVLEFDPAFESRVTVALRYDHLSPDAREKVWRILIGQLSGVEVGNIEYAKLAQSVMNGRQIKNAVRLALALAEDEGSSLTQDLIEQTMAITAIGRQEMVADAYSL